MDEAKVGWVFDWRRDICRGNVPKLALVGIMVMAVGIKAMDPPFTLGGDRFRTPFWASASWVALLALVLCVPWAGCPTGRRELHSASWRLRAGESRL